MLQPSSERSDVVVSHGKNNSSMLDADVFHDCEPEMMRKGDKSVWQWATTALGQKLDYFGMGTFR